MSTKYEPEKKRRRSYTITDEADALMDGIASKLGISKTAVIEIAVRQYAERLEVKPPSR